MTESVVSLPTLVLETQSHGEKFAVEIAQVGAALGLKNLGCMLHVVPPGKMAFPFHRHHSCDEMFFVVAGNGEYRIGETRIAVKAGDCLGAPAGGEAHQIINTGSSPLTYLGLSNNESFDVVEYPDSGKIGVRAGVNWKDRNMPTFRKRGRLAEADYWDGE